MPDEYGNAVVVTVTFKGPRRDQHAARLERAAKRIDPDAGLFSEAVEVEERPEEARRA